MSKEATAWVERWALDLDDLDVQTLFRIDAGLRLGRGGWTLSKVVAERRVSTCKRALL